VAAIGDVVNTQITADDVPCDFGYYCKYFEVTVSADGTFEAGLTHAPGRLFSPPMTPIDMWVSGPGGPPVWMDVHHPDVEGYARMRALRGGTYSVGIVSYEMPGVAFRVRFSLLP
jgi:hypothetical protein